MTSRSVLVPMISALALAAAIGHALDRRRRQRGRALLLGIDQARARATLEYYNSVHDPTSG